MKSYNEILQSIDNFTYLGVNFSKTNSFTKDLKEKSQKIYQSQSVFNLYTLKHPSASAFHTFELFDTLYLRQNYCIAAKYRELETMKL